MNTTQKTFQPHFIGALQLTPRADGATWDLAALFEYLSASGLIIVPKHFQTDLASIPRVAWIGGALIILGLLCDFVSFWSNCAVLLGLVFVFLSPFLRHDGKYTKAAVVHDWIYRTHMFPRRQCDGILLEAMGVCRVALWQRVIIHLNVRLFGWIAWHNQKRRCHYPRPLSAERYGGKHYLSRKD